MHINLAENVEAIRVSQIQYESPYSGFVNCDAYPASPSKTTQQWVVSSSGGFQKLNWKPNGDVRGSYAVTTNSSGSSQEADFTVVAIIDADGDGRQAAYTATKSTKVTRTTATDVYQVAEYSNSLTEPADLDFISLSYRALLTAILQWLYGFVSLSSKKVTAYNCYTGRCKAMFLPRLRKTYQPHLGLIQI